MAVGTMGETYRAWASKWCSEWWHSLLGMLSTYKTVGSRRLQKGAEGCAWGWRNMAADGSTDGTTQEQMGPQESPRMPKTGARRCLWTMWTTTTLVEDGRKRWQPRTPSTKALRSKHNPTGTQQGHKASLDWKKSWIDWKQTKLMRLTWINLVSAISGTVGSKERLNWSTEIIKAHSLDPWEKWLKFVFNTFLLTINTHSSLDRAARFSK